jgi:glycosyltransferase involved in cell wall biosynthesis
LETEIRQSDAVGLHLPGFVQEEDLAALYSLADLFVYPSFYEGFGMPLLEAMACGTPVIVSNVSALPEVIGTPWTDPASHAGLLVSPNDEKGWAQAMARILAEDTLRERLIANGLTRAAQFRWETSAGIVRGVLEAFGV